LSFSNFGGWEEGVLKKFGGASESHFSRKLLEVVEEEVWSVDVEAVRGETWPVGGADSVEVVCLESDLWLDEMTILETGGG
jgi:hypothetical protein